MNETKRVTSTARKISRAWLRRLLWIFIQLDVLILLLAMVGYCYYHEHAALGSDWTPDIERRVELGAEGMDLALGLGGCFLLILRQGSLEPLVLLPQLVAQGGWSVTCPQGPLRAQCLQDLYQQVNAGPSFT